VACALEQDHWIDPRKTSIRPLLIDKLGNNSNQNAVSYCLFRIVIDRIDGVITKIGNTFSALKAGSLGPVDKVRQVAGALSELYSATQNTRIRSPVRLVSHPRRRLGRFRHESARSGAFKMPPFSDYRCFPFCPKPSLILRVLCAWYHRHVFVLRSHRRRLWLRAWVVLDSEVLHMLKRYTWIWPYLLAV
jgi:hypothetical protein